MMKNRKITLWVIIVLLIIFIPITIFSSIMHFKNADPLVENKDHDFKYNGKLYFYNKNELLGTYTCKNTDGYCDYAVTTVKSNYSLDEKKLEKSTKLSLIDNQYAFLMDAKTTDLATSQIFLYDVLSNKMLAKYMEVKNYGVGIEDNYYIVKNTNNKWGVISIGEKLNVEIPFEYDYIGLANRENNETGEIEADIFAVLKEDKWQLIDVNEAAFTDLLSNEIVSYNSKYVVVKDVDFVSLMDFNNMRYLNMYQYINFYDKYLTIIDSLNQFYLYDLNSNMKVSESYSVSSIEDVDLENSQNEIIIKINGETKERIAIE